MKFSPKIRYTLIACIAVALYNMAAAQAQSVNYFQSLQALNEQKGKGSEEEKAKQSAALTIFAQSELQAKAFQAALEAAERARTPAPTPPAPPPPPAPGPDAPAQGPVG